jgi:hypothetical protein
VSSPARHTSSSEKSVASFHDISDALFKVASPINRGANGLTAFSFEFVAKPVQAGGATLFLPAALQSGLQDVPGFAGSLVMVSDQEPRLITVIIFWDGSKAGRNLDWGVRRVRALLAPYLDRCLRAQNLLAHLPAPQDRYSQASSIDTSLITDESIAQEANVCVA